VSAAEIPTREQFVRRATDVAAELGRVDGSSSWVGSVYWISGWIRSGSSTSRPGRVPTWARCAGPPGRPWTFSPGASGGSSMSLDVPIQRFAREIHAINPPALMHPSTNFELYGRVLCGLKPNTLDI